MATVPNLFSEMLRNHLTIALRNIWRNKFFTSIHVLGLSIGISASLVIFLIVKYEFSFDKFEPNPERIYRVVMDFRFGDISGHGAALPAPLANAIQSETTGVEATVPVMTFQGDAAVDVAAIRETKPEIFKKQKNVIFTNNDYFSIVPHEFVSGSANSSLSQPFSVVLTASRAQHYFPGVAITDMIGRRLIYNGNVETQVTGIVKDLDQITDFHAREFISYATIFETTLRSDFMMDRWDDEMAYSKAWVKLNDINDKAGVEKQLNDLFKKYHSTAPNTTKAFALQPLNDVHFNFNYASFDQRVANISTLYALFAIAGFLLLLGCINFVNLSTANASHRAKEIGIRKTIGSSKGQLLLQFLCETFVVTFLATMISISIAPMLLQMFSDFIPAGVTFDIVKDPSVLIIPAGLLIAVGLLSGFYPAIVLSRYRPAVVLKNLTFAGSQTRNAGLRKILTVSQFAIAQFFIIVAFMISKQIHFSLNQDLGYRKEAIVNFEVPRDTVASHVEKLRNSIATLPGVEIVSVGFLPPAMEGAAFTNVAFNNGNEEIRPNVQIRLGEPSFIDLYKIELIAGRNIREGKNINEALINGELAKNLGFGDPSEALQKELINPDGSRTPIVGVMRDFHEGSLHRSIGNMMFKAGKNNRFFHVSLNTGKQSDWPATLAAMDKEYHSIYPDSDFNFRFFDDTIAAFYATEQNTSKLLNWAMGLSILISVLGLLGLVIYISDARTKEIGIRKVLGASVSNLVMILSREFVLLVVVAFVIAAPIAWYAISRWLESFQYRTEVSLWVFAVSGMALLLIAIVTLSAQTIRTARSNPVSSLRNE